MRRLPIPPATPKRKGDELIRATKEAHNALLDLEELDEKTLDDFRSRYEALALKARAAIAHGKSDKGSPETHPV
ncbi:MAG: low affinity iron permease family protein [Deltaproteobacteria bacterium]|nr:low affinity iron permease family protein [Deltaproteobacteria bacterium]